MFYSFLCNHSYLLLLEEELLQLLGAHHIENGHGVPLKEHSQCTSIVEVVEELHELRSADCPVVDGTFRK